MNLNEVTKQTIRPHYNHDTENKVYIVYDEMGNEQGRFPYKDIWNSSPAMRDAEKAVVKIKNDIYDREKIDWENRPLTKGEIEYMELFHKSRKYFDVIKSGTLDDETKEVYYEQLSAWSERMDQLSKNRQVRDTILTGTYDPK